MTTLISKLAEEPYSVSALDTFDYIKKFHELYELLRLGKLNPALTILKNLGKNHSLFPEYIKSKPEDVLPLFNKLVKVKKIEDTLEDGLSTGLLGSLVRTKEMLFPPAEALLDPQEMTADAVDFFMDENMWTWIEEAMKRKLTPNDTEAMSMIKVSVEDLLEKGMLSD